MIGLGLSSAELKTFQLLLGQSHNIRIVIHILDLNHNRKSDVTKMLQDGVVMLDEYAPVQKSANVTFFDPKHEMGLDSFSPSDGALYLDRMLQIFYVVETVDRSKAYTVPIFTGPITNVDRDFVAVRVECQGKEVLALTNSWSSRTYIRGMKKTDAIRDIMSRFAGETRFNIQDNSARLPGDLAISEKVKPWEVCKTLARSIGYQMFYDGRGICTVRDVNSKILYTYSDQRGGTILSKPQVGYDLSDTVNAVVVRGGVPKGMKTPLVVKRRAPSSDPLSPWKLGRNGVPRYLWETIENDSIVTESHAIQVADKRIARGMLATVQVSFDCLPTPHLEPLDMVGITTSEWVGKAYLRKMTIPLTAKTKGTFGYVGIPAPNVARIRRNQ